MACARPKRVMVVPETSIIRLIEQGVAHETDLRHLVAHRLLLRRAKRCAQLLQDAPFDIELLPNRQIRVIVDLGSVGLQTEFDGMSSLS